MAKLTYSDLDTLAGRWSKSEARMFDVAVAPFAQIDAALWRERRKVVYRIRRRPRLRSRLR